MRRKSVIFGLVVLWLCTFAGCARSEQGEDASVAEPTETAAQPSDQPNPTESPSATPAVAGTPTVTPSPVRMLVTPSPTPTRTPSIDGVMDPAEWSLANSEALLVNVAEKITTPAAFFWMNDGTNLYFALRIEVPEVRVSFSSLVIEFDNDGDSIGDYEREEGDDGFVLNPPSMFSDNFRTSSAPCPRGFCGLQDTSFGGTDDGFGAFSVVGRFAYYEVAKPLDSADDAHDFSLRAGDVVGMRLSLRLFVGERGSQVIADTSLPTKTFSALAIDPTPADAEPSPPPTPSGSAGTSEGRIVTDQELLPEAGRLVSGIGGSSEQRLAQVVTPGVSGRLSAVWVSVGCSDTAELTLAIQGVREGKPDGRVLASRTISASKLPTFARDPEPPLRRIDFDQTIQLTAGTPFALVMTAEGGGLSGCWSARAPVGDPYPGGDAWFQADGRTVWAPLSLGDGRFDLPFRTSVLPD